MGGVPEDGVERAVAELLGHEAARAFFDLYVRGTEPLHLDLGVVGVRLRRRPSQAFDDKGGTPPKTDDGKPAAGFLGVELDSGPKLTVKSVREGEPRPRRRPLRGGRDRRGGRLPRGPRRALGPPLRARPRREAEADRVPPRRARRAWQVVLGPPAEDTLWLEPDPDAGPEQRAAFEAWCGGRWPAGR